MTETADCRWGQEGRVTVRRGEDRMDSGAESIPTRESHTHAQAHTCTRTHMYAHTHTCTHRHPDCTYQSCSVHETAWKQRHPVAMSPPAVKVLVSKHHSRQREPELLGEVADSRAGAGKTHEDQEPCGVTQNLEVLKKMGAHQRTQMPA